MLFKSKYSIIKGFWQNYFFVIIFISIFIILPFSILISKLSTLSIYDFLDMLKNKRFLSSLFLTLRTSFIASLFASLFGFIIAWTMVKYEFFGKSLINLLIDLPFALPTAIAGISFASLYSNQGFMGEILNNFNLDVSFKEAGIIIVLIFVGMPFIIRSLIPIIKGLDPSVEQAALLLGANKWQIFYKIRLPYMIPPLITSSSLALARGIGEYGSIIFISGNIPYKTEFISLLIMSEIEQYNIESASIMAVIMLVVSFIMMFVINLLQNWSNKLAQY